MTSTQIQRYSGKTVSELIKIAQRKFNKFIRDRDKENGCISCNTGKAEQAGHYLSQGHHNALRFDENNTNAQCCRCNLYLSGNLINYRIGLVKKIGVEKVEWLENYPKKAHKFDRFTLISIITKY